MKGWKAELGTPILVTTWNIGNLRVKAIIFIEHQKPERGNRAEENSTKWLH